MIGPPSSSDALYLLTDAQGNASTHSASDVNHSLAFTSVRLFAALLQDERTLTVSWRVVPGSGSTFRDGQKLRRRNPQRRANSEAKVKTQETLTRLYQTILQDSLLEIELPFPIAKNGRWELRLSTAGRSQRRRAQITYPDTLVGRNSDVSGSDRD